MAFPLPAEAVKRTPLKRQTRLVSRPRPTDPEAIAALSERSGGLCEARYASDCQRLAAAPHHRQRRSQSGKDTLANLIAVCDRCHILIHAEPAEAYRRGFLVHGWDSPELVSWG